jgi:hypothetical protein
MNHRALPRRSASDRFPIPSLLVAVLVVASGCTSTGEKGITGFDELPCPLAIPASANRAPARFF